MKKIIFSCFLAAISLVSLNAWAQKNISEAAKQSLKKTYPTAQKTHWGKEGANYEASFVSGGKNMSVVVDAKGNILETETAISAKELPSGVWSYLKSKFGEGYKINETAIIVKADGSKMYEAEVKGKDYLFDTSGKFIKSVED